MQRLVYSLVVLSTVPAVFGSAGPAFPLTLLFQNSLNFTQNALSHPGLILASSHASLVEAQAICGSLSESIADFSSLSPDVTSDFQNLLDYQVHIGTFGSEQLLWVKQSNPATCEAVRANDLAIIRTSCTATLPVLCTQSAPYSNSELQDASPRFQSSVNSQGRTFVGYRDFAAFRFLGIPYANPPVRWEYSTVFSGPQKTFNATVPGAHCVQTGDNDTSEDCLFLNIFTPHIPAGGQITKLKAVMFWIHGGSFTNGNGADPTFDGDSLASRGDVVVVTINYRLSTIGFLALDDGVINGNFGLADQITALEWVKQNIAAFGGDPNHIVIFGQSAGAGSVRALLASSKAEGLFHAAIAMSNLAGIDFAATFSNYLTQAEEVSLAADAIISLTNCTNNDPAVVRACLKNVSAETLINLPTVARFVVVDGTFITSTQLPLDGRTPGVSKVPTIWGWMADDGAAFIGFPTAGQTVPQALTTLGLLNSSMATATAQSTLFPTPDANNATLDVFNVSARVSTDVQLRCLDQATVVAAVANDVFPAVFAYQFDRSYQTPGFSPNFPVCEAPVTAEFPNGDPNLPYFRCHSGELFYAFGNLGQFSLPFRNAEDLFFSQYVVDLWTSFGRTFDPNPDVSFLKARGYTATLAQVSKDEPWNKATRAQKAPLRILDGKNVVSVPFQEVQQCTFLGFPLDFYE